MKIVILDGYTLNPGDLDWKGIEHLGEVVLYDRSTPSEVAERIQEAEIVLTNKAIMSAAAIEAAKHLKYIGVTATGYNVVDIVAATKKGIPVTNVPGYGTASVVQLTVALLLELTLHVQRHSDAVMIGKWAGSKDFCFWDFPLVELAGKTLGIIGFGTIGQQVADVAAALGMKVIAHSRTETDQSYRKNFQWVSIPGLLQEADVISLHCPLTPETNGLVNKEFLENMKPSAFLLNTSRGPLVVEQDLAMALDNNVIAGAGIDVLSTEPPAEDNPLFKAKNIIITPHIAWASKEARTRLMQMVADNISAFQSGKAVNVINNVEC